MSSTATPGKTSSTAAKAKTSSTAATVKTPAWPTKTTIRQRSLASSDGKIGSPPGDSGTTRQAGRARKSAPRAFHRHGSFRLGQTRAPQKGPKSEIAAACEEDGRPCSAKLLASMNRFLVPLRFLSPILVFSSFVACGSSSDGPVPGSGGAESSGGAPLGSGGGPAGGTMSGGVSSAGGTDPGAGGAEVGSGGD